VEDELGSIDVRGDFERSGASDDALEVEPSAVLDLMTRPSPGSRADAQTVPT
jgi:hypothetical protein